MLSSSRAEPIKAHSWPSLVRIDIEVMLGEGLGLLENWLRCTLPELQQEGGLSVGAVGPQGASQWRDYPRRRLRGGASRLDERRAGDGGWPGGLVRLALRLIVEEALGG